MENRKWSYIILAIVVVLIAVLGWFLYDAQKNQPEDVLPGSANAIEHGGELRFETILKGGQSGVIERKNVVAKSEAEWRALWSEINRNQIPSPELPKIDFSKEMAIGVFMGQRNTGGYSVEIVKITENGNSINVSVQETAPPPGAIVTQVLTSPFHLVRLPFTNKVVSFKSVLGTEKGF